MPWWCWIMGVCGLWMATFGFWLSVIPPLLVFAFLLGAIFPLYGETKQILFNFQKNNLSYLATKTGIRKLLEEETPNNFLKSDKRLTGSHLIDDSLQEIIFFLMRDFITPWYQKLSNDDTFDKAIRESLQKIVINVTERVKEVEWIPYLTTRLVDDAASHLRFYRLACEKMKHDTIKKPTPQSLASFKSATEGSHSRNNSDGGIKTTKSHSRNSSISDKPVDLETMFFRVEGDESRLCHDQLCFNREAEKNYLDDITDAILYIVLPPEDFHCLPVRILLREIVIGGVIEPLFDMLSEPDYINRCIVWLCSDINVTNDAFLSALRVTFDKNELTAVADFVNKEMAFLRSRDGGAEADLVKQQLSSLIYISKTIEHKLQGGPQKEPVLPEKLIQLSLTVILTNNVALSYFIDYLSTLEMQNFIFLHIAIESWKASITVERQRNEGKISKNQIAGIRDAALSICQQYLGDEGGKVRIDLMLENYLIAKITQEAPIDSWFDDLQTVLLKKLAEKFLPEFYRSNIYLKLLSDLELLKDDNDSPDNLSLTGSIEDEDSEGTKKQVNECEGKARSGDGRFQLKVDIIDSGVVQDKGKTYGMYALSVVKTYENGFSTQWHVYRRYSDFYDLQQKIKDYYCDLGKLPFPGKKTFNNMGALTLAKRMKMLNDYLQILLHSGVAETHLKLPALLLGFLEPGEYDKAMTFGSAFESMVSPIKSSMRSVTAAVKTVPENLLSSVDVLSKKREARDENVPVRIMLLLMDEVFDLQSRNQWLRRRIVTLLRQVFGDLLTRKLLDYVEELTGAIRVAGYISSIKEMLWPNGIRTSGQFERDEACRQRTKLLAKASLLSAGDDLKHLLGVETTRKGLLRVFCTFQNAGINRRLAHVMFEGVTELIFPSLNDLHYKLLRSKKNFLLSP